MNKLFLLLIFSSPLTANADAFEKLQPLKVPNLESRLDNPWHTSPDGSTTTLDPVLQNAVSVTAELLANYVPDPVNEAVPLPSGPKIQGLRSAVDLILSPAYHFLYVSDQDMPARSDCGKYEYTGAPQPGVAEVALGCTEGGRTWINKTHAPSMTLRELVKLVFHELVMGKMNSNGYGRRVKAEHAANITNGIDLILNHFSRQFNGEREVLSAAEMIVVQKMIGSIWRTFYSKAYEEIDFVKVHPAGGVYKQAQGDVGQVYLGFGSFFDKIEIIDSVDPQLRFSTETSILASGANVAGVICCKGILITLPKSATLGARVKEPTLSGNMSDDKSNENLNISIIKTVAPTYPKKMRNYIILGENAALFDAQVFQEGGTIFIAEGAELSHVKLVTHDDPESRVLIRLESGVKVHGLQSVVAGLTGFGDGPRVILRDSPLRLFALAFDLASLFVTGRSKSTASKKVTELLYDNYETLRFTQSFDFSGQQICKGHTPLIDMDRTNHDFTTIEELQKLCY